MTHFRAKSVLLAGLIALSGLPASAQTSSRFEGTLNVVWGDPRAGASGGEVRFNVTLPDGKSYPLIVAPAQQGSAMADFGKHVVVRGTLTTDARGQNAITAARIDAVTNGDAIKRGATETRRVLYILLKFKGDSQKPHDRQFYLHLTNPKKGDDSLSIPATINGFFAKTSWGNLQWQADVTEWMTLPYAKMHYANCGWSKSCANLGAISSDAFALAAAAGINLTVYDNINFVLNNDLDCCAWGGGTNYHGKNYGATWEPPWGQEAGTYSHEFGHSIGLPHSGWAYYSYDSPWDIMSARTSSLTLQCGSYFSANDHATDALYCTEPGDGYIAGHKDYLGWTPAANQVVIDGPMTQEVVLEANATPLKDGIKMIKICLAGAACSGSTAHYLTVESRIGGKLYENGLTGDGVIIHDFQLNRAAIGGTCYFNNQSGWAVPIDATPGDWDSANCSPDGRSWPDYALGNAEFLSGQTYTDDTNHVSVEVKEKNGNAYVVQVTRTQ